MNKIGKFRGIPVYVLSNAGERLRIGEEDELMYVFNNNVYYHKVKIATLSGTDLKDFDEEKFETLLRKSWQRDAAELAKRATSSAETRPQEEERPDKRTGERDAANDIVEQFMNGWRKNIDNEIAVLKNAVAQMGEI